MKAQSNKALRTWRSVRQEIHVSCCKCQVSWTGRHRGQDDLLSNFAGTGGKQSLSNTSKSWEKSDKARKNSIKGRRWKLYRKKRATEEQRFKEKKKIHWTQSTANFNRTQNWSSSLARQMGIPNLEKTLVTLWLLNSHMQFSKSLQEETARQPLSYRTAGHNEAIQPIQVQKRKPS